ncbi:hypothetical protein FRC18_002931 [Serendipita sp. 400]|nr:hypothetical protein FRC18_002931 [Serendipita sp. 400]
MQMSQWLSMVPYPIDFQTSASSETGQWSPLNNQQDCSLGHKARRRRAVDTAYGMPDNMDVGLRYPASYFFHDCDRQFSFSILGEYRTSGIVGEYFHLTIELTLFFPVCA